MDHCRSFAKIGKKKTIKIDGVLDYAMAFGDHYFHPSYEITLNKEGTLVIVFDIINTMIV